MPCWSSLLFQKEDACIFEALIAFSLRIVDSLPIRYLSKKQHSPQWTSAWARHWPFWLGQKAVVPWLQSSQQFPFPRSNKLPDAMLQLDDALNMLINETRRNRSWREYWLGSTKSNLKQKGKDGNRIYVREKSFVWWIETPPRQVAYHILYLHDGYATVLLD